MFLVVLLLIILLLSGYTSYKWLKYYIRNYSLHQLYIPKMLDLPRSPDKNPIGINNPLDCDIQFEDIEIKTIDGIFLRGWFCPQPNSTQHATIIYFQEEMGSKNYPINQFIQIQVRRYSSQIITIVQCNQIFSQLLIEGMNIYVQSYANRFSNSTGSPNEKGLQTDADTIVSHVSSRLDIDQSQIFIHGRSLGASLALSTLTTSSSQSNANIRGVILDNPILSSDDLIKRKSPFKNSIHEQWHSFKNIGSLNKPSLFIIASQNQNTSQTMMDTLYDDIKFVQKQKYVVEGANVQNIWCIDPFSYFGRIQQFISNTIQSEQQ